MADDLFIIPSGRGKKRDHGVSNPSLANKIPPTWAVGKGLSPVVFDDQNGVRVIHLMGVQFH